MNFDEYHYSRRVQKHKRVRADSNQFVEYHYIWLTYKFLDEIVVQCVYDNKDTNRLTRNSKGRPIHRPVLHSDTESIGICTFWAIAAGLYCYEIEDRRNCNSKLINFSFYQKILIRNRFFSRIKVFSTSSYEVFKQFSLK
jgi:hypothetical protein